MSPESAAQIVADAAAPASRQAGIGFDGMGRPLVNIQAPSAAGVSRNVFSRFDVGVDGVVLNNARDRNPLLGGREAGVILNEVNSSRPSSLLGTVAVEGARAHVVIANPSGLQIDGARFVNASRVTLTTGAPIVENGEFRRIEVRQGSVKIGGRGLDMSSVPYAEILGRAARISARIDARKLHVITGAQDIDPADSAMKAAKGTGEVPALAIDTAALGGMYADSIVLMATEAGVGVRNAGSLRARDGDGYLFVSSSGRLENAGHIEASRDVILRSSGVTPRGCDTRPEGRGEADVGIRNTGLIRAGGEHGNLLINTKGTLESTGHLEAPGDIRLTASAVTLRGHGPWAGGAVEVHAKGDMRIEASRIASVGTGEDAGAGPAVHIVGGDISLRASGLMRLTGVRTQSTGSLLVSAGRNLVVDGALSDRKPDAAARNGEAFGASGNGLRATEPRAFMPSLLYGARGVTLAADGNLYLTGATVRAEQGTAKLRAQGSVLMNVAHEWARQENVSESTGSTFGVGQTNKSVTHRHATRTARVAAVHGQDVRVEAGRDIIMSAARLDAGRQLEIEARGDVHYLADRILVETINASALGGRLFGVDYRRESLVERSDTFNEEPVRLHGGRDVLSRSGGNQVLQGTEVVHGQRASFIAGAGAHARNGASLFLSGALSGTVVHRSGTSNHVLWDTMNDHEIMVETAVMPSFSGAGELRLLAPGGLEVRLPADREAMPLAEVIGGQHRTDYLKSLMERNDVSWQRLMLNGGEWHKSRRDFTAASAALLTTGVFWGASGWMYRWLAPNGLAGIAKSAMLGFQG